MCSSINDLHGQNKQGARNAMLQQCRPFEQSRLRAGSVSQATDLLKKGYKPDMKY